MRSRRWPRPSRRLLAQAPQDEGKKSVMTQLDYRLAFRFFVLFVVFEGFLGATFLPSRRASESPIAIACLRLLTVRPEPPLFKVPALRFFIARSTVADAAFEYLRAIMILLASSKIKSLSALKVPG